jgi:hypothetical protein
VEATSIMALERQGITASILGSCFSIGRPGTVQLSF